MSGPRRHVSVEERRARLGIRHLLAPSHQAAVMPDVAQALIGLHATDPSTVFLAAAARTSAPDIAAMEQALYEERSLERMLCMRRTMFVVPTDLAPVIEASTGRAIAAKERAACAAYLRDGAGWSAQRYAAVEADVLAALAARGEASAAELAADVPALREQVTVAPGKPYEARQAVSSRILRVLAAEGRIRRGRPTGRFNSNQFRWSISPLADAARAWETGAAKAELARRYLAAFGPVTTEDLKWWTGWTLTDTRKALTATGALTVGLDEGTGFLLPEDLEPVTAPEPWVALLPGLDPTAMGWRQRDFHLDSAHIGELYDRNGNIGPTVWADGHIIGAWTQHRSGSIRTHLLADPGAAARHAVDVRAQVLGTWLGDLRITPHYRTPLERRLAQEN
ncbi:winged helix DNA-binding domain-containing protein (plasmid) [Streptomyces sp. CA-294286]|uniref:winged helix DNA-binding domain-containing protein n=1 Tax=Streptomyces sp. CA-294286 TaxID=3240070 RepID=UPI003D9429E3